MGILTSREFNIPIISVGNITVGGTGKTPHTEYLVKLLSRSFNVATLSRGYKRKTRGFYLSDNSSTVFQLGDEPLQIKKKFPEISVAVDEKRVRGIEHLLALENKEKPDVIILDDAFQHRYVKPGSNILLIDYNRIITRDRMLPAGRLREPASNRFRANIIIVTKCPVKLSPIEERIIGKELNIRPYQTLFFTTLSYGEFIPVFPEDANPDIQKSNKSFSILLVTGIANPEPLKDYLFHKSIAMEELNFPDHYNFTPKDIENIADKINKITGNNKIILTTEKDMVRLRSLDNIPQNIKELLYYIPLEIQFMDNTGKSFDKKIIDYVRENKSNFDLYSGKSII
jgi:tetraacyldisaccharide 4'-kinase